MHSLTTSPCSVSKAGNAVVPRVFSKSHSGRRDEGGVGEIHWRAAVLAHQGPHAPPFPIFRFVNNDEAIIQIAPQCFLRRNTTRPIEQVHRVETQREWCGSSWSIKATSGPVSHRVTDARPASSLRGYPRTSIHFSRKAAPARRLRPVRRARRSDRREIPIPLPHPTSPSASGPRSKRRASCHSPQPPPEEHRKHRPVVRSSDSRNSPPDAIYPAKTNPSRQTGPLNFRVDVFQLQVAENGRDLDHRAPFVRFGI